MPSETPIPLRATDALRARLPFLKHWIIHLRPTKDPHTNLSQNLLSSPVVEVAAQAMQVKTSER